MNYNNLIKIVILVLIAQLVYSQNYIDSILVKKKSNRSGFAIGYNPIYILRNYDDINTNLADNKMETFSKNMYSGSFMFYIYPGLINNIRIGGFFSSGEKISEFNEGIYNKKFSHSMSIEGLSIDYAYPVYKKASLAFGLILGCAEIEQTFSTYYDLERDYNSFWENYYTGQIYGDSKRTLITDLFIYSPYISFEYAIWDFSAIRFGGGYLGSKQIKSKFEDFYELKNPPKSAEFNNFYLHAGILIGLFFD
jgi:hypothetical protein